MAKLVNVTGTFLDVSNKPLQGNIRITPAAEFIAEDTDTVYSGPIEVTLDEKGKLDIALLPTGVGVNRSEPWLYRFNFDDLRTKDGYPANIKEQIFEIPKDTTVPQLLDIRYTRANSEPVIKFGVSEGGDLIVEGARVDPQDPGALIVPIAAP